MEPDGNWPRGLTLEEDLIDLGWHQREFDAAPFLCLHRDGAR